MNKRRWLVMAWIGAAVALLAACGEMPASLPTRQQDLLATAWSAGQTAEAIGDYIRATESARIYQTAAAQQTQAARAMATATAQQNVAFQATMAAAQTQSALDVRQRELDIQAQQDAVEYQRSMYAEQLKREQARTRLDQFGETVKATARIVLPIALAAVALFLLAYGGMTMIHKRGRQVQVLERGPHGLLPAVIDPQGRVYVPDRQFWNVYDPKNPMATPIRAQAALDEGMTRVQGVAALSAAGRPPSTRAIAKTFNQDSQPEQPGAEEVLTADWRWMDEHWRPGAGFVLGLGSGGTAVMIDPDKDPHLLIAGTTGSGKTLEGALPLATTALAAGYLVVVANGAAGDYSAIDGHSNLVVVRGSAENVTMMLEAAGQEVDRRDGVLAQAGVTTWSRLPGNQADGPHLVIIVDELVALAWEAKTRNGRLAQRLWTAVIHITSKGRKMGIHLVAVTTDPTYRTLGREGLIMRDNCARLVFRLRGRAVSMAALDADGAEALPEHHFLATVAGQVVRGISFNPSMVDLSRFLERRSVPTYPRPGWLSLPLIPEPSPSVAENRTEAEIVRLWREGLSMNDIQRTVFGYTGGAAYDAVRSVITAENSITTTDSEMSEGDIGPKKGSSTDLDQE